MAKRPADRPVSADAMADELRAIRGIESGSAAGDGPGADPPRRAAVPRPASRSPRPTSSPSACPTRSPRRCPATLGMIVRSSAVAARFATGTPDLKALAAEADVDRVVMGTLLRAGDQLRATAQLVDAPGGTLLTSHTVQASLGDLFGLQDDIARRVADALSLPLAGTPAQSPDRPADPQRLPAVPARQRAGADLRRHRRGARSLPAVPRARSALRAGVGPARALPSRRRQVHRARSGQRRAGRGRAAPGPGAQPPAVAGAQVLRQPRSRHRPGVGGAAPPARRSEPARQRSRAVRRARPRVPLLRPVRAVDRGARRGPPPRSQRHRPASSRR